MEKPKERLFKVISAVVGLVIALMMGELALVVYADFIASEEKMDDGFIQYNDELGWSLARNWRGEHHHFDYTAHYTVDLLGLRKSSKNPSMKRGAARTLIVGDSFTFGLGVEDDETFVSQLNLSQSDVQFINGGIPGYSPDQVMLWLPRGIELTQPDHVVVVVYLGNDLIDIGLPYPVQAVYSKPFAELTADGSFVMRNLPVAKEPKPESLQGETLASYILEENPAPGLKIAQLISELYASSALDRDAEIANKMAGAVQLFAAVLDRMLAETSQDVTLVLLPGASVINKGSSLSARYQLLLRAQLVGLAQDKKVPLLDMTEPLLAASKATKKDLYYRHDGHLTPGGHRVVATALFKALGNE